MKEGFFFNRVDGNGTWVAVYKTIELTVLVNPHPAAANLVVVQLTLSGTKFTFNLRTHTYILSHTESIKARKAGKDVKRERELIYISLFSRLSRLSRFYHSSIFLQYFAL